MGYYRMRPPKIKQAHKNSCWAAVLESFSRVTSGVPKMKEQNLCDIFGIKAAKYGLAEPQLDALQFWLNKEYGIEMDLASSFTKEEYMERIRQSYVPIMYNMGGDDWHAWLVYGVSNCLCYMDPKTGTYEKKWLSNFSTPKGVYVFHLPD